MIGWQAESVKASRQSDQFCSKLEGTLISSWLGNGQQENGKTKTKRNGEPMPIKKERTWPLYGPHPIITCIWYGFNDFMVLVQITLINKDKAQTTNNHFFPKLLSLPLYPPHFKLHSSIVATQAHTSLFFDKRMPSLWGPYQFRDLGVNTAPTFKMFNFHRIRTCDFMEENQLFVFLRSLGQTHASGFTHVTLGGSQEQIILGANDW